MSGTKKTESLTVRLDPKTKFGLELMARVQHRTITGVVESALLSAMSNVNIHGTDLSGLINGVWSTDEITRFVYLALVDPYLLTYEELRAWETIRNSWKFWRTEKRTDDNLDWHHLRRQWGPLMDHVREHYQHATVIPFPEFPEEGFE